LIAANATLAVKVGLWFRRVRFDISAPDPRHPRRAQAENPLSALCRFAQPPLPAYTVTIHKSQGSEYPAVIIPVMTQHYTMLQRNLLYTGVTRGKRLVVLVGQRKAIAIAVRNVSGRRRWSKLKEWLRYIDCGSEPIDVRRARW
jgi:ATP-dependent exoDNAse (exonuclease V) alpha subunit